MGWMDLEVVVLLPVVDEVGEEEAMDNTQTITPLDPVDSRLQGK
jgi:hypothetical protein